jgi:hypothetical protein
MQDRARPLNHRRAADATLVARRKIGQEGTEETEKTGQAPLMLRLDFSVFSVSLVSSGFALIEISRQVWLETPLSRGLRNPPEPWFFNGNPPFFVASRCNRVPGRPPNEGNSIGTALA